MVIIGGLQKLTLIDYPGKLACTVFLQGCNYRCPWCYNQELVLPEKMPDNQLIEEKDFFGFLEERQGILEGVCIGGGEPTLQPGLPKFCHSIKKAGFKVKLDTNGSNPQMVAELIAKKLIDYAAMDIKAPRKKYLEAIGFRDCASHYLLDKIQRSIDLLKENKIDYEFRTTVNPLLQREDVLAIAHWLKPAKRYFLQNFRPERTLDPQLRSRKFCSEEDLFELQKSIAPFFETCQVR